MKKLFLLLATGILFIDANAQNLKSQQSSARVHTHFAQSAAGQITHHKWERTTSTAFVTENFGSGTSSSLPVGWTAGSYSGSLTWQFRYSGDQGAYGIGSINSTTAADGFMMYNSDSIGGVCSCSPSGWLQSPKYNCTAHATVELSFEEYLESYFDSSAVWVGTDSNFTTGTYQTYTLPTAVGSIMSDIYTANPYTVTLNISSAAGGQSAVYIRFVYYSYNGAAYSWMVDDLSLSDVTPIDLAVEKTDLVYCKYCTYWAVTGTVPIQLMDTLYPVTNLNNYGQNAEANDTVTAVIYKPKLRNRFFYCVAIE